MLPGPLHMIQVTRLNGTTFSLNALYIEKVESFPDTTITLTTGSKYVVKDSANDIHERILTFYRAVQLLSNPYIRGEENEE